MAYPVASNHFFPLRVRGGMKVLEKIKVGRSRKNGFGKIGRPLVGWERVEKRGHGEKTIKNRKKECRISFPKKFKLKKRIQSKKNNRDENETLTLGVG